MSILSAPHEQWLSRQVRRATYREAFKQPAPQPEIVAPRRARRAMRLGSLATAAALLFATQAEAFHNVCDLPAHQVITRGADTAFISQPAHLSRAASDQLVSMSILALKLFHKGHAGVPALVYNTLFGTDTATSAATGWDTYAPYTSVFQIWLNSSQADDTGNGQSAAAAKKTFGAAITALVAGAAPGVQLRLKIAGTSSRSYTDPGSVAVGFNFTSYSGISKTYPIVIECYDPAGPANTTKYGKLLGPDRPVLDISTVSGSTVFRRSADSTDGLANFVMQGIILDGNNTAGPALEFTGRHDGMAFQNCTFRAVELLFNNSSSALGLTQDISVTKCSFFGAWFTDGNSAGMFDHGTNNLWVTDCNFIHCAWKIGASRDDATTVGGVHTGGQGHSHYHHATSTNFRCMRNVYGIDSADGLNARGDVIASDLVTIDEPIALTIGGFSTSVSERPAGVLSTLDNFLVIGGSDLNSSNPRGYGFNLQNVLPGSYARNGVMIENAQYADTNNYFVSFQDTTGGTATTYGFLLDKIYGYNYSSRLQGGDAFSFSHNQIAWTNSILDVAAVGYNDSGATTGNSIWDGSSFPLKKTAAQIYTAMGFASRNAMFDAMAAYPHLPWAQALISIGLPAYGTASTTAPIISPPDISGLPAPTSISWGA